MEEDEEFDDWDAEFGFDDGDGFSDDENNTEDMLVKGSRIVGITADRLDPLGPMDDWGDDFDLGSVKDSLFKKALRPDGMSLPDVVQPDAKAKEDSEATFADDDDEDWDEEFGIDVEEKPSLLQSLLPTQATTSASDDDQIPEKHRFLQGKSSIRIVKFPMPTQLFSLREKDNHRVFLSDKDMCQWLGAVVSKHKSDNLRTQPAMDVPVDIYTSNFLKTIQGMEKPSPEWLRAEIQFCTTLCRRDEVDPVWGRLKEVFAVLEKCEIEVISMLSRDVHALLYIGAKQLTAERKHEFEEFCAVTRKCFPDADVLADIVLTEGYAHCFENVECVKAYLSLFKRVRAMPDDHELKELALVRTLSGFHLFLSGFSPLNTKKHRNCDAQEDLYFYITSIQVDEETRHLLTEEDRVALLEQHYVKLDLSIDKARAAYALALHSKDTGKNQQAERRFFEALYVLDEQKMLGPAGPALIVSEFGSHCLREFGDMLLYNYKYKYGILAYHECSVSYFLRRRSKDYFQLVKEMASMAIKHDDVKRGVMYYKEVLQICIDEGKTNEMIYVSEVLSKIYTEIGRFQVAEEFLLGAFSMLAPNDPQAFMLRLKLAQIYLKGFHQERGITLLTQLLESNPPKNKKLQVITSLIKGHLRKRNYDEVARLLRLFSEAESASGHSRGRSHTGTSSITSKAGGSGGSGSGGSGFGAASSSSASGGGASKRSATYYELEALNLFYAQQYPGAVTAINRAIERCSNHNLRALGRLFFIRGKIFQHLSSCSVSLVFPTTLTAEAAEQAADAVHYRCKGDLMQETIATYRKAYEYFGAAGDEVGICKTVARIAETYLEATFPFVALLQHPLDSVSSHPAFSPSAIADPPTPSKEPVDPATAQDFVITCAHISGPATLALNIATELSDPLNTMKCYINLAELRYLEEDLPGSMKFWNECRSALVANYLLPVLGKEAPPANLLRKLFRITERLVRCLFAYDAEMINKNLFLIDALHELEVRIGIAERRRIRRAPRDGSDLSKTTRIHAMKPVVSMAGCTPLMKAHTSVPSRRTLSKTPAGHRSTRRIVRQSTVKNVRHLFNVEEEILRAEGINMPMLTSSGSDKLSAISGDHGGSEDASELVWNCLHCAKALLGKFSEGKMTKEDVFNMNQKYIRKLCKVQADRYCAYSPLLRPPKWDGSKEDVGSLEEITPDGVAFDELAQSFRRLKRAMFLVKTGPFVCAFVPHTGEKRIRTLSSGAEKEEGTAPGTPRDSDASSGEKRMFYVKVQMTCNGQEHATFTVRRGVTLQALLDFIMELPNSGLAQEEGGAKKSSGKRLFNSFSRNTARSMKSPTRYIDGTRGFTQEVAAMMSLGESAATADPLRVVGVSGGAVGTTISFASKTRQGQDSYLLPMTGSLALTFEQCFPMEESTPSKPLLLYLFATSTSPLVSELLNSSAELRGHNFGFSEETVGFMSSFLDSSEPTDVIGDAYTRIVVEGVLSNSFRWIAGMVPEGGVKIRKKGQTEFPFHDSMMKHGALKTMPRNPLLFICSKELQAIPWELVFGEMIVRYFGLGHAVNREHYLKEEKFVANTLTLPLYHAFCFASYDKTLLAQEEVRKKQLVEVMRGTLQMSHFLRKASEAATLPFHNVILRPMKARPAKAPKKRKAKIMNSIDLRQYMDDPTGLLSIANSLRPHEFPVFLLSYNDLVEQVEATFEMLCWSCRCTFLFVPASAMKEVSTKLMRIQERYAREVERLGHDLAPNQYQYFMSVVSSIQSELAAPVVIINTP